MYRTGDIAQYGPDDNIEYIGRADHQVKLHGSRVELGEIEATLRQHAAIKEAVVTVHEDAGGDKRLVAYFVPAGSPAPAAPALRRFLEQRLPGCPAT